MSGPKVVRIVTREEILEICHGHLARVDAALAEWTRIGRRNDCIDEEALAACTRRRVELARLLAADRFMDLQKQAPLEEAFLRDDLQARLAAVAERQAAARSRERRDREAAATLLRTLHVSGRPLDAELERRLARGEAGALAAGFDALATGSAPSASATLAASLREEGPPRTLADWLAAQPPAATEPATERLEFRIAELTQLVAPNRAAGWSIRLEEAISAAPARRGLMLDGLEVETGRALTEARRLAAAAVDLELALAELSAAGMPVAAHREGVSDLDADALSAKTAAVLSSLADHRAAAAAASRRAAVLAGLAGLGYEVTEGMSTSLAHEGRLVLRSATRPDYGVEVAAAGERMQMRPVAFESGGRGPDAARDRDAETIWCGDVSSLQQRLGELGGGLAIEKALPIGATPLKRVAIGGGLAERAVERPAPRERSSR